MAENQIEFVIRARDLASQAMVQLNQSLESLEEATKGADRGLKRVERGGVSTSRTISVLTRTTRFAAIGFISELDPAIGQAVARMSALGSVASSTGSLLKGGLVVGGITLVVGALSNWLAATNRQLEFQLQLNRTVAEFNVQGATSQIRELVIQQDQLREKSRSAVGGVLQSYKDFFNLLTTGRTQAEELTDQFVETRRVFDRMRTREFVGQMAELATQIEAVTQSELQRRLAHARSAEEATALGASFRQSLLAQQEAALARLKVDQDAAVQRAVVNELGAQERTRIEQEFGRKRELIVLQSAERIKQAEQTLKDAVKAIDARENEVIIARMEERRRLRIRDAQETEAAIQTLARLRDQEGERELQDTIAVGEKLRELQREAAQKQVEGLQGIADAASATIKGTLSEALSDFATTGFVDFKSLWQRLWQSLVQITADAAAQMLLFGKGGFGGAGGAGGLGGVGQGQTAGGLVGLGTSLLSLFGMQKGGLVMRPTAALLHPGERVIPAGESGAGGGVTVINLSDPEKLAGLVAQETSKGREVVVNDVLQGMRSNRAIRRGIQRFR
jgi:hypothetical protein